MKSCTLKTILFLTLSTAFVSKVTLSQSTLCSSSNKSGYSRLVVIDVEVRDRHGDEITSLTKDNFIIYENGVKLILNSWERIQSVDNNHPHTHYRITCYPVDNHHSDTARNVCVVVRANGRSGLKVKVYKCKDGEVTI